MVKGINIQMAKSFSCKVIVANLALGSPPRLGKDKGHMSKGSPKKHSQDF
jgi:hypothetical protein